MKRILPIVEGDGDLLAVPELARRVLAHSKHFDVTIVKAHRRGDLPKVRGRFDDYLRAALLEECPILWVMDYDCADCSDLAKDRADLMARARKISPDLPIEFVFMVKEFESLFLSDWETTKAVFTDIPTDLEFPSEPEQIRDAKGWLSKARPKGKAYKPTQHQQRLASQVNLDRLSKRSDSFRSFRSAVLNLADLAT